ncbi:EF-hand domain-containing protein [Oceanobacter mangrovi]|uniref:EF-hand domain-containing protein n=1 Tax=Oceanobacter mangrovi TaxID=2862510 RepID=UPI001C8E7089|nr:EF-hand domain-containing protein [Oceanobacter mangrovi]
MRIPALSLTVLLLGSGAVMAAGFDDSQSGGQGGRPPKPPSFSELDQDGDGYVSKSEASVIPPLSEHFSEIDSDGDGKLSEQELESHKPQPPSGGQPPQ